MFLFVRIGSYLELPAVLYDSVGTGLFTPAEFVALIDRRAVRYPEPAVRVVRELGPRRRPATRIPVLQNKHNQSKPNRKFLFLSQIERQH